MEKVLIRQGNTIEVTLELADAEGTVIKASNLKKVYVYTQLVMMKLQLTFDTNEDSENKIVVVNEDEGKAKIVINAEQSKLLTGDVFIELELDIVINEDEPEEIRKEGEAGIYICTMQKSVINEQ